ncbi:MAG: hypothetical protein SXQ77_07835 [Halobacteria archaeon]|nr:hypothetical protein [Halobacteria archaeon]
MDNEKGSLMFSGLPLYAVFGMEGTAYWTVIMGIAFVIIGLVVLNQLLNDTLILKE